tara:strand:+ start:27675 stop:28091 length:417 start_codon:yes stop_codon:yes gene_type:complete
MEEIRINEAVVNFKRPNQIINMGGPWVGDLYLGGPKLANNILIDNLVYNKNLNKLFFVQYIEISKWQRNNFFTINYFDVRLNRILQYEKKFERIFLKEISNEYKCGYYDAFHDENEKHLNTLDLNNIKTSSPALPNEE